MALSANESFIQLALKQGMLSVKKAEELKAAAKAMESHGLEANVAVLALKKGFLNKKQVGHLSAESLKEGHRYVGEYRLLRKLGQGAYGSVFRARRKNGTADVALKILNKSASTREVKERFKREGKALLAINHPHVVKGHEIGEADGYHFIAMDLIEGPSVEKELNKRGVFSEKRILDLTAQLAASLKAIHAGGVVHRDIKPANILTSKNGDAVLVDLGLTREGQSGDNALTQEGNCVGTPYYVSPEQVRSENDLDIRSDMYSLGATLYHLATGRPPYQGTNPVLVISQHLSGTLEDPRIHRPDLSSGLASIILKMLARQPNDRYPDADKLLVDIQKVKNGEKPLASDPQLQAKQKKILVIGSAVGGLLAIVVGLIFLFGSKDRVEKRSAKRTVKKPIITDEPASERSETKKKTIPSPNSEYPKDSDKGSNVTEKKEEPGEKVEPAGDPKKEVPVVPVETETSNEPDNKGKPIEVKPETIAKAEEGNDQEDSSAYQTLQELQKKVTALCQKEELTEALLEVERAGMKGLNEAAPEALDRLRGEIRSLARQLLLLQLSKAQDHAEVGREDLARIALRKARLFAIRPDWEADRRAMERRLFVDAKDAPVENLRRRVDQAVKEDQSNKELKMIESFQEKLAEAQKVSVQEALIICKSWEPKIPEQYFQNFQSQFAYFRSKATEQQWNLFWPKFLAAVKSADRDKASSIVADQETNSTEEMEERLAAVEEDLKNVDFFFANLKKNLKRQVGKKIQVGKIEGILQSFENDSLVIHAGPARMKLDLMKIDINHFLKLGKMDFDRVKRNSKRHLVRILILLYRGHDKQAQKEFQGLVDKYGKEFYFSHLYKKKSPEKGDSSK